jgi:hypothetical protein
MVLDSLSKTQKLGMVGILATIALVAVIGRKKKKRGMDTQSHEIMI